MPRDIELEGGRMPQLPVDPNVTLPPSVRRRAEAANAAHAQAYAAPTGTTGPAPGATGVTGPSEPTPGPTGATGTQTQVTASVTGTTGAAGDDNWESRYLSMKGRYDASQRTIGAMQEQISTLASEVMQSTQALQRVKPAAQPQAPQRRVTQQDIDTYSPELVDLVARAAQDALAPIVDELKRENLDTRKRTHQTAMSAAFEKMDEELPDWRIINDDPKFRQWLQLPDIYSGKIRQQLLSDAQRAANAPRMLAFFRGFISDGLVTGSQQATPQPGTQQAAPPARQAAVQLETLAAPGKAKPAPGEQSPSPPEKPVITRGQVKEFYDNVRRGYYNGRVDEYHRQQEAIFAAQREGRIR